MISYPTFDDLGFNDTLIHSKHVKEIRSGEKKCNEGKELFMKKSNEEKIVNNGKMLLIKVNFSMSG